MPLPLADVAGDRRLEGDLDVLGRGWSSPEATGCWTDGPDAFLHWTLPCKLPVGARFRIRGRCFAPRGPLRGFVSISVFPVPIIYNLYLRPGEIDLSVPILRATPDQREVNVHIHCENAYSPQEVGLSSDSRRLGLFVQSIAIE